LNALRHQYDALLAEFKTARNHFLSVEWRSMRGKPFEVFLKDVFEYLGYDCRLTAKSGDQGIDLIAKKEGTNIAIQAKAYQNSIGNDSVQQAVAGMRHYGCNQCAVITNSRFTPSAIELARTNNCKLIDETQIESLIVGEAGF
jgi:restriction system protein